MSICEGSQYLKTPGEEESAVGASAGEHEGGEEHDGDAKHHGDVVTDSVDDVSRDWVDEDLEKERIISDQKQEQIFLKF